MHRSWKQSHEHAGRLKMSSKACSIVGDVFPVDVLATATAVGIATRIWYTQPHNIRSLLRQYKWELEMISRGLLQ